MPKMSSRFWPCPQCSFRSNTKRGIQMHWTSRHAPTFRSVSAYPQSFMESLSPEQFRLLGTAYQPEKRDAGPAALLQNGLAGGSGLSFSPGIAASFPANVNGYGPHESRRRPRLETPPWTPTPDTFESGTSIPPVSRAGSPEYLRPSHLRVHGNQPRNAAQLAHCTPEGSSGADSAGQDVGVRPFSAPGRSNGSRERATDLLGPGIMENGSIQEIERESPPEAAASQAGPSSVVYSASADSEMGDRTINLSHGVGTGLKMPNSSGGGVLRNLWPTCLSSLVYGQPHELCTLALNGDELRPCGNHLPLLGDCTFLDYNALSPWDIVLRCSVCGVPKSGIRNMETHIRRHFQGSPSTREVRSRTPSSSESYAD